MAVKALKDLFLIKLGFRQRLFSRKSSIIININYLTFRAMDTYFSKQSLLLFILVFFIHPVCYSQIEEESVFFVGRGKNHRWISHPSSDDALYQIISKEALQHLEKRKNKVVGLKTEADWFAYQNAIKEKLTEPLSKFEKSPLKPEITGVLERENFIVEKIIYESHPKFYVTACLFIPKARQNQAPAIIYCSGHNALGFRSETYQHIILNLVEKGFVVLAYDPIGQGERLQYLDLETGKSAIGSSTQEHSYAGVQTSFTGSSLADYFIWDGIRAVDYLSTRSEIDMKRIGISGRSGGGTQAAMIAACDDRILAAAPENYITNFKRLFQAIGPQDAEQNPWFGIARGIDHPDFIHARAPKPTLIISTTNDYFNIQGARETFNEAKKSYSAFGMAENIQMTEDFGKHESTLNNRKALYAFFQKHLDLPGNNKDIETKPFLVEELWSTKTGQIGSSKPGETIFSLNKKQFSKKSIPNSQLAQQIAHLAGIEFNHTLTSSVFTGKIYKDDTVVEKYFIESQHEDYVLPVYVAGKKGSDPEKILVWVKPEGNVELFQHKMINELINQGYTVISADLPGIGELHNPDYIGDGTIKQVRFNYLFGANLVGKSIAGIQAEAFDLLIQFINTDARFQSKKIHALVEGTASAAFLHYTAFKNPFEKSALITQFLSEKDLVFENLYPPEEAFYVVPGSLSYYNLSDLLKFHQKDTYKVVPEFYKNLSENGKTGIIGFLNSGN